MEKELNKLINRHLDLPGDELKKNVLCQFYTLLIANREEELDKVFRLYFSEYYSSPVPFDVCDN